MKENADLGPPRKLPLYPTTFKIFTDGIVPAYWLPGQYYNTVTKQYDFQDKLPNAMTLHIPKMGRFIYTYGDDKNISDDWGDAEIDGGGDQTYYYANLHLWRWNQRRFPNDPNDFTSDMFEAEILGGELTGQDNLNRYYRSLGTAICGALVVVKKNGSVEASKSVIDAATEGFPQFSPYAQVNTTCS